MIQLSFRDPPIPVMWSCVAGEKSDDNVNSRPFESLSETTNETWETVREVR